MLACVRLSGSEADVDYVWVPFYRSAPQFPAWESSIDLLRPLKDFYSPSLLWWQETRLLRPFVLDRFHLPTRDRCMYNTCHSRHSVLKVAEKTHPLCLVGQKCFKCGKGRVKCQSLFWALGPRSLQSLVCFTQPLPACGWPGRERGGVPYVRSREVWVKEYNLEILVCEVLPALSCSEHWELRKAGFGKGYLQ